MTFEERGRYFKDQAAAWAFLRDEGGLAAGYSYPVDHGAKGWYCYGQPRPVNEVLAREACEAAPGGEIWARAYEATKYAGVKGKPWQRRNGK